MDAASAQRAAEEWIAVWNRRDLDGFLDHYAEEVEFCAPTIVARWGIASGKLTGKAELRKHFARGLEVAPNTHFELVAVLHEVNALTVLYRRETGALVADAVELDQSGKVIRGHAYYSQPPRS